MLAFRDLKSSRSPTGLQTIQCCPRSISVGEPVRPLRMFSVAMMTSSRRIRCSRGPVHSQQRPVGAALDLLAQVLQCKRQNMSACQLRQIGPRCTKLFGTTVTHPQSQSHGTDGRPLAYVAPQARLKMRARRRLCGPNPGRGPEQGAYRSRRRGAPQFLGQPSCPPDACSGRSKSAFNSVVRIVATSYALS